MKDSPAPRRLPHVIGAGAVIVVLAGLLFARFTATAQVAATVDHPRPAPATVPAPPNCSVASLQFPCWGCPEAKNWAIRFRTDLDLLAPLGNGARNAAEFFKDFARPDGPREAELDAARKLRFEHPKAGGMVFPYDHALVREAEPWCDQATMRYYPDFFPLKGFDTQLPDLIFQLTLARTWVARGYDATDPDTAMADFRRAIRLGRLLRQEDVVIINDLVGLACIRLGAEGIYDLAAKRGDTKLALLASFVLGEYAPQRLLTAARLTETDLEGSLRTDAKGTVSLGVDAKKVDTVIERARSAPDRRFRCEAIVELNLVRFLAAPAQQERARAFLEELAHSDDHAIASAARSSLDVPPSDKLVASLQKASPVP
jgi:hypothetical protein